MDASYVRKPEWLRVQLGSSAAYRQVADTLREGRLHTVCEEARCPNQQECWARHRTATFMILGDTCTRRCRFCNVKTGLGPDPDPAEPERVAASARSLGLRHVVITMVTRDDLPDGGADLLARTVRAVRQALPEAGIEVLSSDLMGRQEAICTVLEARPDIMGHNLETVRRLSRQVRSRSDHDRSLAFLAFCAAWNQKSGAGLAIKSSLMLGLGEEQDEVLATLDELRAAGVDMVNLGQYLQPAGRNLPVQRYWTPAEFAELKDQALQRGFRHVESGPLVRSSYHAGDQHVGLLRSRNAGPQPG